MCKLGNALYLYMDITPIAGSNIWRYYDEYPFLFLGSSSIS